MAKLFAGAKAADKVGGGEAKGKASKAPSYELNQDVETHAAVAFLKKSIDSLEVFFKERVNVQAMEVHFLPKIFGTHTRPENAKGTHGLATSSLELRVRGANSPLSEMEENLLTKYSIATKKVVVRPAIPERYFLNSDLLTPEVMKAIEQALSGNKALATALAKQEKELGDLLMLQPEEPEVTKVVADEVALDQVCQIQDEKVVRALLPIVSVQALKPSLDIEDMGTALKILEAAHINLKDLPVPEKKK